MIFDERALLSDDQDMSAGGGAAKASTNSYDLGVPGTTYDGVTLKRNIGKAGLIPFLVMVNAAITSGDGATGVTFTFQTDEDVAFGTPKDVMSVTVPIAELVAGYILPMDKLPRSLVERYLRMYYAPVAGTMNAGSVTAGVVAAVDGAYQG